MAKLRRSNQRLPRLRQHRSEAVVDNADIDWSSGIAEPLFSLSGRGASDEELLQFIRARQAGDLELAESILRSFQRRPTKPPEPGSEVNPGDVLFRLRVEAIRPCVNSLDVRLLHDFLCYVAQLSESILSDSRDAQHWNLPAVVLRVAEVIRNAALEQVAEVAKKEGISPLHSCKV